MQADRGIRKRFGGAPAGLAAVLCLALSTLAGAQSAPPPAAGNDAYSARVNVSDQTAASRDSGLRKALNEVLLRVSGGSAGLTPILQRANSLVQHYHFERTPDGAGNVLVAAFDPQGVETALRQQSLPVFGVYASATEELAMRVDGIASAADYGRTLAYLRGLPGVKSVAVDEYQARSLRLRLTVEGGSQRVAGAAAGGGVLRASGGGSYSLVN